jgi:putative transposase
MKKPKFSEEQITSALRQAESGTAIADACRQLGISEATFYPGGRSSPLWA